MITIFGSGTYEEFRQDTPFLQTEEATKSRSADPAAPRAGCGKIGKILKSLKQLTLIPVSLTSPENHGISWGKDAEAV